MSKLRNIAQTLQIFIKIFMKALPMIHENHNTKHIEFYKLNSTQNILKLQIQF
jgi:hypothetical protein